MTDSHCHVTGGDPAVREFLIGRDFIGVHPWECLNQSTAVGSSRVLSELRAALEADPRLGVGEIGLDRLKERTISPRMREVFEFQLKLALEFRRPVVLHGAKCWGQVVEAIKNLEHRMKNDRGSASENSSFLTPHSSFLTSNSSSPIPHSSFLTRNFSFLFHGFSRSDGLIPDIVALNGYISVGPAVLNDHAVNYRELVKKIPSDRLLLETDRTEENAAKCPSVAEVAAKVAELRGMTVAELETATDRNADDFFRRQSTAIDGYR